MLTTDESERTILIVRDAWLLDLGRRPYREVWDLQKALVDRRAQDKIADGLILVEHDPVATLGRRGTREDVLDSGLEVVEVERGGEATYHGPGQLVGYPILKLPDRLDVRRLVTDLEEVLLRTCADFGIEPVRQLEDRIDRARGPAERDVPRLRPQRHDRPRGVPEDPAVRARRRHHDLDGAGPRTSGRPRGRQGIRHRALPGGLRRHVAARERQRVAAGIAAGAAAPALSARSCRIISGTTSNRSPTIP